LSTAYFVTLGILLQPIPSRSLAGTVLMPHTEASFAQLRDAAPVVALSASPRLVRVRATQPRSRRLASTRDRRPLSAIQLASYRELPAGASDSRPDGTVGGKRPNLLNRFFRGVIRTVQPVGLNPEIP
jgi:hypothetical protein